MQKGKYVDTKFTADQKKARAIWTRAREQETALMDGLMLIHPNHSRKELHRRLDKRLDQIERLRAKAEDLFSDVDESFTIASLTL